MIAKKSWQTGFFNLLIFPFIQMSCVHFKMERKSPNFLTREQFFLCSGAGDMSQRLRAPFFIVANKPVLVNFEHALLDIKTNVFSP